MDIYNKGRLNNNKERLLYGYMVLLDVNIGVTYALSIPEAKHYAHDKR